MSVRTSISTSTFGMLLLNGGGHGSPRFLSLAGAEKRANQPDLSPHSYRGTRFTLSRDELLTLPEFVLLSLFPNGLLPDGHMQTYSDGDIYPVDVCVAISIILYFSHHSFVPGARGIFFKIKIY
jgi:hypothetical protein